MNKRRKEPEARTLEGDLNELLGELCVKGGFCLSWEKSKPIVETKSFTAKEFAFAVLVAEGFDHPEYRKDYVRMIVRQFEKFFGQSQVSARDYEI